MLNTREYPSSPIMENFETASNVSEGVSSNLSSLSGLTGYEEELYDLKHFIKLPSSSPRLIKSADHGQYEVFEERIRTLNVELQNSLKLNEKYKNDMENMERKTELRFHEKFEKLLRHNAQLEAQLSVANDRIRKFYSDFGKFNENQFEQKLKVLEKQDFELHGKVGLLEDELKHWRSEAENNEVKNSRFKLEMEEMKVEVSTKTNSIDALKSKIVELHLEMQNLNQDNVKVHNLLAITCNELDSFKKSEKWYKEQLHQCRAQKSEALEEISKVQANLLIKDREFTNLKNNLEELCMSNVQEKEKLLKNIEQLQREDRKIIIQAPQVEENVGNYESIIENLTRELISIKDAINQQQALFDRINKENSELITQNTTLKKYLNDKEIPVSNLESEKIELNVRLDMMLSRLRENEKLLMKTVEEKAEIEVNLCGANREKREIEDAVKTIRENFSKFAASYNKIKEELNKKNKEIFQIQHLKETNILELEEINRKLNQHILELQQELVNFNSCSVQLMQAKTKIEDLQTEFNESKQKFKGELNSKTEELQGLKANMTTATSNLCAKDKLIVDLKQDLNNSQKSIESVQKTNQDLLEELQILNNFKNKFEQAHQLLQKENLELKDKLNKFVTNNFNNFNNKKEDIEYHNLEIWASNTLNWICLALHEIQANHQARFSLNPPQQCSNKNLEATIKKISELLGNISAKRFEDHHQMSLINKTLKEDINKKIKCLEDRFQDLDKRQEEDLQVLGRIRELSSGDGKKGDEELKQLKILYKAKELENNEKRKRYEVNNRTLLKKVKEHMRGRNSAEKRCSYLQELYNNVFDELNSYKLQENSKEDEIQNLQSICENYKNINAKMKQELVRLEKDLTIAEAMKVCVKCLEYETLKKTVGDLGIKFKISEEQLKEKEILINNIQMQIQQSVRNNSALQKENKGLLENVEKLHEELRGQKEDLKKLEITLEKERKNMEELQGKLLEEQKQHSSCIMQLESAQQVSQHIQEKNKLFSEEIELLNSNLNNSKNEFNSLKAKNDSLTDGWSRKETLMQTFVMNLQSEIQVLQTDLVSVRSDKNFLQRLCADLKLALETSLNQSKVLKKHVQNLSSESKESSSLPDSIINLPSPSKYDDAYIHQLLKQSTVPNIDKPLGDLQNCLNSLKKEMVCLRKQVTDRTGSRV